MSNLNKTAAKRSDVFDTYDLTLSSGVEVTIGVRFADKHKERLNDLVDQGVIESIEFKNGRTDKKKPIKRF